MTRLRFALSPIGYLHVSPSAFDVLALVGRERVLARLQAIDVGQPEK